RAVLFFAGADYEHGTAEFVQCALSIVSLAAGMGCATSLSRLIRRLLPPSVAAKVHILRRTASVMPTRMLNRKLAINPFLSDAASMASASSPTLHQEDFQTSNYATFTSNPKAP